MRVTNNMNYDRMFIIENNDDTRAANTLGVIGTSDMQGSLMLLVTGLIAGSSNMQFSLVDFLR